MNLIQWYLKKKLRKSIIPEIEALEISDAEIPPPAQGVTIEKELARYKNYALQSWQDKLKDEKNKVIRAELGYRSPRNRNGNLDWKKVWQMIGRDLPSRKEIFPNNEDQVMSEEEMVRGINQYLEENEIGLWLASGVNIEEYPEVYDSRIRSLCEKINSSDWARTRETGIGSRDFQSESGESLPNPRGFRTADMVIMLDRRSPQTEKFVLGITQMLEDLKKQHSQIRRGITEIDLEDSDLNAKDVKMYSFGIDLRAPEEWKRKIEQLHGQDFFDDVPEDPEDIENKIFITELPQPEDFLSQDEYVDAYAQAYRRFNYERDLFHRYVDRYYKKYGEYFRSEEAEQITNEFFMNVGKVFEELNNK